MINEKQYAYLIKLYVTNPLLPFIVRCYLYVGIVVHYQLEIRKAAHRSGIEKGDHDNAHIRNVVAKYGLENVTVEFGIISEFDSRKEVAAFEKKTVEEFRLIYKDLFLNIADGGEGGDTYTHNPRKHEIRNAKRGPSGHNTKSRMLPAEPTIAFKKNPRSRTIICEDMPFPSYAAAERGLKTNRKRIWDRVGSPLYPKYYYEDEDGPSKEHRRGGNKSIKVKHGDITYDSIDFAAEKTDHSESTIRRWLERPNSGWTKVTE